MNSLIGSANGPDVPDMTPTVIESAVTPGVAPPAAAVVAPAAAVGAAPPAAVVAAPELELLLSLPQAAATRAVSTTIEPNVRVLRMFGPLEAVWRPLSALCAGSGRRSVVSASDDAVPCDPFGRTGVVEQLARVVEDHGGALVGPVTRPVRQPGVLGRTVGDEGDPRPVHDVGQLLRRRPREVLGHRDVEVVEGER